MVIGDLPQASHILCVACDFFLVEVEFGEVIIRPDLLRLELQGVALAPFFILADAGIDFVPEADLVASRNHVVLLKEGQQLARYGLNGFVIVPDILESASHIE